MITIRVAAGWGTWTAVLDLREEPAKWTVEDVTPGYMEDLVETITTTVQALTNEAIEDKLGPAVGDLEGYLATAWTAVGLQWEEIGKRAGTRPPLYVDGEPIIL